MHFMPHWKAAPLFFQKRACYNASIHPGKDTFPGKGGPVSLHQRSLLKFRLLPLFFALLFFAVPLSPAPVQAAGKGRIALYFPCWNIYQDEMQQVKNLPWDILDSIQHAFWKIIPHGEGYKIAPSDAYADLDSANPHAHFPQYAALSRKYPQVNILLSIGGWNHSGHFSQMAASEKGRASFIESCLQTLESYPFLTGLDIDWEYPGIPRKGSGQDEGNPVTGDDFTNYTLLLKELRAALDSRFGKGVKKLTICAGGTEQILKKQDYAALHPFVDAIHLMTYDLALSSQKKTGHHAPLYGALSADSAVQFLLSKGVPAGKLLLGTPLYSHGWSGVDFSKGLLHAPASGKNQGGVLPWKKVKALEAQAVPENIPGWHAGYDDEAQAAYLWNDDPASPYHGNFLTYESERSLESKLQYLLEKGLQGIMIWESGGDDAKNHFPMLQIMHRFLHP